MRDRTALQEMAVAGGGRPLVVAGSLGWQDLGGYDGARPIRVERPRSVEWEGVPMRRSCRSEAYLTADEVTAILRLPSRRALHDRVRRGTCPAPFALGRTRLWAAAEIEAFVEENRVTASSSGSGKGGGGDA